MSGPDRQGSEAQEASSRPSPSTREEILLDRSGTKWAEIKNYWNVRSGRTNETTEMQYLREYDDHHSKADCTRCEKNRDHLLKYSPIVKFMQDKITNLGGVLNAENIVCQTCPELMMSGFDPDYGILLCANRVRDRKRMEDAMAHEMVHAYDHLRFKLNWSTDLNHAACTEIRASSLSGECRFANEFFRNGIWRLANQHQNCVKRRATLSVRGRKACNSDYEAAKAINTVWESCFADTRPFDEIYR